MLGNGGVYISMDIGSINQALRRQRQHQSGHEPTKKTFFDLDESQSAVLLARQALLVPLWRAGPVQRMQNMQSNAPNASSGALSRHITV